MLLKNSRWGLVFAAFALTVAACSGGGAPTESHVTAEAAPTGAYVIVPDETTAGYSVDEIFFNENNRLNTAVGTTHAVEGYLTLNRDDPAASTFGVFTADLSTLKSDKTMRDNRIRSTWLESAKFPLATFVVSEVRGFPANPQEDQAISFQLVGDLTVKETTREAVWDVTATLSGDTLSGHATTFMLLADWNIPVPSIAGMLKVTDGVTLNLDFVMRPS